ncbi:MAG: hypothetical protein ABMA64_34600, partial [Myxococcota bacterium]
MIRRSQTTSIVRIPSTLAGVAWLVTGCGASLQAYDKPDVPAAADEPAAIDTAGPTTPPTPVDSGT